MDRVQWRIQRGVESPFDSEFHLHWKFWTNLIDFGYFSSTSLQKVNKFYYLLMFVKLSCGVLSGSTLFAQASLSEYVEYVRYYD